MANSFEKTIEIIIRRCVAEIAEAVRADLRARLDGLTDAPPARRDASSRTKVHSRVYPPGCLGPGPAHPFTGGPRGQFLCDAHRESMSAAQKRAAKKKWKAELVAMRKGG